MLYLKSYIVYSIKLKNNLKYNTSITAGKCLATNKAAFNIIISIQNITNNLLGIFF